MIRKDSGLGNRHDLARSRDNLPDPVTRPGHPYVPVNSPAIGNLMEMFRFPASKDKSGR